MLFIIFSVLAFHRVAYASSCEYTAQIDQCREENKWWDPRSIDEFLCPQNSDTDKQAYQVVLDGEFSKLDEEVEDYLNKLQSEKDKYYSGNLTYLDGYDEITRKLWRNKEYWEKYNNLCDVSQPGSIVEKTLVCLWWSSSSSVGLEFFKKSDCTKLVETKLTIYQQVAADILYLNRIHTLADKQKRYSRTEKNHYSTLLDAFTYNIWMIQKIAQKWVSKNKKNGAQ